MFLSARPSGCRSGPISQSRVAAPNVATLRSGSNFLRLENADKSIKVPSVALSGVNECPVPGARTGALPWRTAAANATSSFGATISLGLQTTPPDQLDHFPPTILMTLDTVCDPDRRACRLQGGEVNAALRGRSYVGEFRRTLLQVMVDSLLEIRPFETRRHFRVRGNEGFAEVLEIGFPDLRLHHRHGSGRNRLGQQSCV